MYVLIHIYTDSNTFSSHFGLSRVKAKGKFDRLVLAQNFNRQAIKVLLVGGDDNVFNAASNV